MTSQEGLSLEVVKDHFLCFLFGVNLLLFIAPPFCKFSYYYKLAEVPGGARGILKIESIQKGYP